MKKINYQELKRLEEKKLILSRKDSMSPVKRKIYRMKRKELNEIRLRELAERD